MVEPFPPLPHDPILEAVGAVAAAGASVEWALVDLHEMLLGGPRAHVAVAGESFEAAKQACLHLAKHIAEDVDNTLAQEVRAAVTEASRVWERRGAVVHGLWLAAVRSELPPDTAIALRLRKSGLEENVYTVEELHAIKDEIVAASDTLVVLADSIDREDRLGEAAGKPTPEETA